MPNKTRLSQLVIILGLISLMKIIVPVSLLSKDPGKSENPYALSINRWLEEKREIDLPNIAQKSPNVRGIANNAALRAWGLTHPLSSLTDANLIQWHKDKLIEEIDYLLQISQHYNGRFISGGNWNVERFVLRNLLDAIYMVKKFGVCQESVQTWLQLARIPVEWQYNNYWNGPGQVYLPGWNNTAGYYPNSDAMYILTMGLAGEIYNEAKYRERAHEFVLHLEQCLLPDGAFNYIFNDNEIPVYHSLNVVSLARYFKISNDSSALYLIEKTENYYPLSFGSIGHTEKTGFPWFKKQMDGGLSASTADIVAFVTGDGRNKYLANKFGHPTSNYVAVDFWNPDIALIEPENNYIKKDKNLNGLRGRFGDFSWITTFGHGAAMEAFVGAIVAPSSEKSKVKYAEMELVSPEICIEKHPTNHYLGNAFVSSSEFHRDIIQEQDFAAISVSYNLYLPWREFLKGQPIEKECVPWTAHKIWLLLPDNIIGLIFTKCNFNSNPEEVRTRIRVSPSDKLTKLNDSNYNIENLQIKIHNHNYSHIDIEDPAQTGYKTFNPSRLGKEIVLTNPSKEYKRGDSFFLSMEVHPDYNKPVEDFQQYESNGLVGFKLKYKKKEYLVLYNPGKERIIVDCNLPVEARIIKGGESYMSNNVNGKIKEIIEPLKLLVIKK